MDLLPKISECKVRPLASEHYESGCMCPVSCLLAPCEGETFFCHSNMCINNTLVCNGIQNCVYPWDENRCKGTLRHNSSAPRCIHYFIVIITIYLFLNVPSPPLEKRKPSILDTLDNTNLTIIGVTCGLVVILLIISVIIQVKQPRKKYVVRRWDFWLKLITANIKKNGN